MSCTTEPPNGKLCLSFSSEWYLMKPCELRQKTRSLQCLSLSGASPWFNFQTVSEITFSLK